ncbi:hypothetical protein [Pseudonocardia sp.]|jgi:O-acetylhomoserine/O-acetylserine sulfhydrylase-like pyridoxal-dependent enzyme|uniref:hypothetical protein n=1 Tax=Pseudonocardia sp. TaxID=60912 RepID=UPI002D990E4F|nr:hypothetical protein [Pseudonocardia sp.]
MTMIRISTRTLPIIVLSRFRDLAADREEFQADLRRAALRLSAGIDGIDDLLADLATTLERAA